MNRFAYFVVSVVVLVVCVVVFFLPSFCLFDSLYDPQAFHQCLFNSKRPFFEGWYHKLITNDGTKGLAVIPGVFLSKSSPDFSHAFVLVATQGVGHQFRFPFSDWYVNSTSDSYEVHIGSNVFSPNSIQLDLTPRNGDDATASFKGSIQMGAFHPWPTYWFSVGVMGPLAFFPMLECSHAVLGMDHLLVGSIEIHPEQSTPFIVDFEDGSGYVEKDWGTNFPSGYIWVQANSFIGSPGTSIVLSAALMPVFGTHLPGFFAGVLHNGTFHTMATYWFDSLDIKQLSPHFVSASITSWGGVSLSINAESSGEGTALLYGPRNGEYMEKYVLEGLLATLQIELIEKGEILFQGTSIAAFETEGDLEKLQSLL